MGEERHRDPWLNRIGLESLNDDRALKLQSPRWTGTDGKIESVEIIKPLPGFGVRCWLLTGLQRVRWLLHGRGWYVAPDSGVSSSGIGWYGPSRSGNLTWAYLAECQH